MNREERKVFFQNIRYIYKNTPEGDVICIGGGHWQEDYYFGMAICEKRDQFNRKTARDLINKRLSESIEEHACKYGLLLGGPSEHVDLQGGVLRNIDAPGKFGALEQCCEVVCSEYRYVLPKKIQKQLKNYFEIGSVLTTRQRRHIRNLARKRVV